MERAREGTGDREDETVRGQGLGVRGQGLGVSGYANKPGRGPFGQDAFVAEVICCSMLELHTGTVLATDP